MDYVPSYFPIYTNSGVRAGFKVAVVSYSDSFYSKNLYELLGIDSSAKTYQIKKAYRNLAKQYHPDKNKDPDTEAKFKDITFAYEVHSHEYNLHLKIQCPNF